jgi:hypothetical protein
MELNFHSQQILIFPFVHSLEIDEKFYTFNRRSKEIRIFYAT